MNRNELDRREQAFREALRDRHARVDPDGSFSARVLQRLPDAREWSLDWAAKRVLPASVGLAAVLAVAALVTHGRSVSTVATKATTGLSAPATAETDPLDWLLQGDSVSR